MLDEHVKMYKRLGEIDWIEALERMPAKASRFLSPPAPPPSASAARRARHPEDQPAAGADAVQHQLHRQPGNYDHLHLNVLKTYAVMFLSHPGLSDHTHALAPVLEQ